MKIELVHDILARKVYEKSSTEDKMRLKVERFIREEYSHYQDRKILLQKKELDYIEPYLDDITLPKEAKTFIEKSKRRAQLKRLWMFISLTAVVLLISVFAIIQNNTNTDLRKTQVDLEESRTKYKSLYCLAEARKSYDADKPALAFRILESVYKDYKAESENSKHISDKSLFKSLEQQMYEIQETPLRYRLWQKETVTDIAFSSDGRYYLTAGRDDKAVLWSLKGERKMVFLHKDDVVAAAFLPNSQGVVTASQDSTVCFWDLDGHKNNTLRAGAPIKDIVLSPNGKRIFTSYLTGGGKIWSSRGGTVKDIVTSKVISKATFNADSKLLAYLEFNERQVKVWNEDNSSITKFTGDAVVTNLSFEDKSGGIMLVNGYGYIQFFNSKGAPLSFKPQNEGFAITDAKLSPDGTSILVIGQDNKVEVWSRDGRVLAQLKQGEESIEAFDWGVRGELFGLIDKKGEARIYASDGELLEVIENGRSGREIVFSTTKKLFSILDGTRVAKIWTIQENLKNVIALEEQAKFEPDFINHTDKYISLPLQDNHLYIWDDAGHLLRTFNLDSELNTVQFSKDGSKILTTSADGSAVIWDTLGTKMAVMEHEGEAYAGIFNPVAQELVTISENQMTIWDTDGYLIKKVALDLSPLEVTYSPDGKHILVILPGQLILYDNRGNVVKALEDGAFIRSVDFSENGKALAAVAIGTTGDIVKTWDLATFETQQLPHYGSVVNCINFLPESDYLIATGTDKGNVKIWDLDGAVLGEINNDNAILSIEFSKDIKMVITTRGEEISIWQFDVEFESEQSISVTINAAKQVSFYQKNVGYAKFAPDNKSIISISDRKVNIWGLIDLEDIVSYYDKTSRPLTNREKEWFKLN